MRRSRLFAAVLATLIGLVTLGLGASPANANTPVENSASIVTAQYNPRAAADKIGILSVDRGLYPSLQLCIGAGLIGQALDEWDSFLCYPQIIPTWWRLRSNR